MGQTEVMTVAGLLLAAGAGRRMGRPKALVEGWLPAAVAALHGGGCERVLVVLGAEADQAAALLPAGVGVVVAPDWESGMGASLRAGLVALGEDDVDVAVVSLVDLPDVGSAVVSRLLGAGVLGPDVLRRAAYDGRPGHPVVLGCEHWAGVLAHTDGDRGARDYLRSHSHDLVECGDLATGIDVDRPGEMR